jgi:hypothetical protein
VIFPSDRHNRLPVTTHPAQWILQIPLVKQMARTAGQSRGAGQGARIIFPDYFYQDGQNVQLSPMTIEGAANLTQLPKNPAIAKIKG